MHDLILIAMIGFMVWAALFYGLRLAIGVFRRLRRSSPDQLPG